MQHADTHRSFTHDRLSSTLTVPHSASVNASTLAATFKMFQQPHVQAVCAIPQLDVVAFREFGWIFIAKRECAHTAVYAF
jgi:hypothetical protein